MQLLYNFVLYPILYLGFYALSFFNAKVKKGFELRKNKGWLKPVEGDEWVWFHVASGELEYAKPVIKLLKKDPRFKCKVLITFFSPSVLSALEKTAEIDLFVPMPWDTPRHWRKFLNHYHPRVLAIARTDTWPNLVWQTRKAKIPAILFSATLPSTSGRVSSFFGRLIYENIFENLTHISVVSEEDKDNFLRLSSELSVSIDGDTRYDQAISRVAERRELPLWTQNLEKPCFVAGSTWPEDEKQLAPGLADALMVKDFTTLIVPHEPTEKHLTELENAFRKLHIKTQRYSAITNPNLTPVILVDKIGILADLYRLGKIAFVGGSFKKSVHSVMEPAASGALTFFGPYYHNNREALALRREGLAQDVANAKDITQLLLSELNLPEAEKQAQRTKILKSVEENKGMSVKIANWILEKIPPHKS